MTETPNRHVDIIPIAQPIVQYVVFAENGKERAGYAIITVTVKVKPSKIKLLNGSEGERIKEAAIWFIYTDPQFRRQGYAKTLLEAMKVTFDIIYTQAVSQEGKKLLMDNGFVREEGEAVPLYQWWKEKNGQQSV
jgi:ribosomal protein S18 acetylase RimI-like enzyme